MIKITNTESGESTEAAYEMVPEGTLDMIEAKDKRIAELEEELEIKNAVIERWEEEFDHMASQEFFEEIEIISEGGAVCPACGSNDMTTTICRCGYDQAQGKNIKQEGGADDR